MNSIEMKALWLGCTSESSKSDHFVKGGMGFHDGLSVKGGLSLDRERGNYVVMQRSFSLLDVNQDTVLPSRGSVRSTLV